jgi:hypothetical protein
VLSHGCPKDHRPGNPNVLIETARIVAAADTERVQRREPAFIIERAVGRRARLAPTAVREHRDQHRPQRASRNISHACRRGK